MNIPIYRAKKIDSDKYIEGFLYQDIICYVPSDGVKSDEYKKALDEESWFITDNMSRNEMIDITTVSIHFPDMLDSQGNKIFASLQKDGKGGDIVDTTIGLRQNFVTICLSSGVCVFTSDTSAIKNTPCKFILDYRHRGIKVVGIQKEPNERN